MRLCVENSRITLGSGMPVRYTNSLFVCVPSSLSLDLRIGIHTSTAGSLERSAVKAHEFGREYVPDFLVEPENVAGEAARSHAGSIIEARA